MRARPGPWLVFLGLAALACWDRVLGPYALVRLFDSFESEFPHYLTQARLLLEHGFFQWNPYLPGGMPALAGQHGPHYPLVLACAALPPWLAAALLDVLLLALAGWGMYRLARDHAGACRPVAATGALLFALSLIPALRHFVLAHAFPACFVWLARSADPDRPLSARLGSALALAGVLGLAYPVLSLPLAAVHLLFIAALPGTGPGRGRLFLAAACLWTGYALLSAPVIAGLWEFLPLAHRTHEGRIPALAPALLDFVRAFVRQPWEGQPCFPFLVLGLPLLAARGRGRALLGIIALLSALRAMSDTDLKFLLGSGILSKPDWGIVFQLMATALGLGAVLVLDAVRRRPPGPAWPLAALAATLVLGRFQSSTETTLQVLSLVLGLSAAALARPRAVNAPAGPQARSAPVWLDRFPRARVPVLAMALAWGVMASVQHLVLEYPHVPYARAFSGGPVLAPGPGGPFRVGSVDLHPAVALGQGLETVDQKRPLFNRFHKDLVGLAIAPQLERPGERERFRRDVYHLLLTPRRPGADLFLSPSRVPERSARDFNLDLLGAMNVRHLLSFRPIPGMEGLAPPPCVARLGGAPLDVLKGTALDRFLSQEVYAYRLPDALERAFLAARAEVLGSREEVLDRMGRASIRELADTAFFWAGDLEGADRTGSWADGGRSPARPEPGQDAADAAGPAPGPDPVPGSARPPGGQVRISVPAPDRLVAEGEAAAPGFLVVSNNFDPGWEAELNGRPARVLRTDHAFQALRLDAAGPFRAELSFRPALARTALWVSAAGPALMLLPALCAGLGRKGRKGQLPGQGIPDTQAPPGQAPGQPPGETPGEGPEPAAMRAAPGWAALMALAWAVLFYFFMYRKGVRTADPRPLGYVLAVAPVAGLLAGCWARTLLGRFFRPIPPLEPGGCGVLPEHCNRPPGRTGPG